jgi:thiosulfate/3-mercaptopyruvate sulfurtransferase
MTRDKLILSAAAVFVLACGSAAASPAEPLVVSTGWLAQHLNDPDLVLLHVGDEAEYEATHLPGARFVSARDLSVSDRSGAGLTLELPPAEDLRRSLEALGVSDASRVVVYYGNDWVSPATRVLFTLDYAGLGERAALLDGGMKAWVRDGHPVTSVVPPATAGTLSPLKTRPLVVDGAWVGAHLNSPSVSVVDARLTAFYDGTRAGGSRQTPHRAGHVKGARSVPFDEIVDDQVRVRPLEELREIFARAGVKQSDTIVAYCHIGQQATAVLFAARLLGHPALLYDGSFEDWSRRPDAPVENPASPGDVRR